MAETSGGRRTAAQQLDRSQAALGFTVLDPIAAHQAAMDYLAARGATGTASITPDQVTVTVHRAVELRLLTVAGGKTVDVDATATVAVVRGAGP